MPGITAENLKRMQDDWNKIDLAVSRQDSQASGDLRRILESLEKMGLDLKQDETYELLAPGLTKAAFDTAVTHAAINDALQQYHRSVSTSNSDYVDVYNARRAYGLEHLMKYQLPGAEENIAKTGLPAGLPALAKKELSFVFAAWHDGTLEDDMKRNAALAAHDDFRAARGRLAYSLKQAPDDRNIRPTQEGLSYADSALKMIGQAGAHYKAAEIPAAYGSFGGWDKDKGTVHFSREAVEEVRKGLLMRELGMKFSLARKFQDDGEFVLDSSGGGYSAMVMPMQDIAGKLKEYGHDIHDPETFKAIGTDIDTFRACYQRERTAVQKNDEYKLLKPEFKL